MGRIVGTVVALDEFCANAVVVPTILPGYSETIGSACFARAGRFEGFSG